MAEYSIYCCEPTSKIENYELAKADNFKGWEIHHRFETHDFEGVWQKRKIHYPASMLKALDVYYNRPAEELIWLTSAEHCSLHMKGRKHLKPRSKEYIEKQRIAQTGKKRSEETKAKQRKPKSEEAKRHMSEAARLRCLREGKTLRKGVNNEATR